MIIFVIGPSGVGKSSLCKALNCPRIKYIDLDSEMKKMDVKTFYGLPESIEFENLAKLNISNILSTISELDICIVDVGAGCLVNPSLITYMKSKGKLMTIIDSPENAFFRAINRKKRYWQNRFLKEYLISEFSERKKSIFDNTEYIFDIQGADEESAKNKFAKYIEEKTNL